MTCFSVQPMYRISVKGYGFLSLAKNMGRNFGKNKSENLSSKYSQKIFDMLQSICYRCTWNYFKKSYSKNS